MESGRRRWRRPWPLQKAGRHYKRPPQEGRDGGRYINKKNALMGQENKKWGEEERGGERAVETRVEWAMWMHETVPCHRKPAGLCMNDRGSVAALAPWGLL